MNWSPTRLLAAMGLMTIPGAGHRAADAVPAERADHGDRAGAGLRRRCRTSSCGTSARSGWTTLEEQFPEALDFLARSMRAGHAFSISLEMLGEEMAGSAGPGVPRRCSTSRTWARRSISRCAISPTACRCSTCRFFTSSVLLQKQTGGNLSEILSRLAYVIRERFRLKGQVKAASAHGRLTATILTLLPVVTMLGAAGGGARLSAGHGRRTPDGKKMIGGAIVAQILGNFFIKKIINIKV